MDYLSQQQQSLENIPYMTPKHSNHDNLWLLPGVSTPLFCFGCAIENLENKSLLCYRKKHILTDLLEIFLTNRTIWQLFGNKNTVNVHVVKLLLDTLMQNNDQELSELAAELCLLIMKRTSQERIAVLVTERVSGGKLNNFENQSFVRFLSNLLGSVPSVVLNLCDNEGTFTNNLLRFISTCKENCQLPVWSLLCSVLRAVQIESISLPQSTLKQTMVLIVECSTYSTTVDLEILKSLQAFLAIEQSQKLLLQHECSHLTTTSNSVLEFLKKMLMCSSEEGKALAISCIATIAESSASRDGEDTGAEFSSLLNFIIERGITEYLLELLLSSNQNVLHQLFECLEKLTHCQKFHSLGHMVYGLTSIIKAVSSASDVHCINQGLVLINVILKGRLDQVEKSSLTKRQEEDFISLVKKHLETADNKTKNSSIQCLCTFLECTVSLTPALLEGVPDLLELVFLYMEKDIARPGSQIFNFVTSSYRAALLFAKLVAEHSNNNNNTNTQTSSNPECDKDDVEKTKEMLFYYCDKFFIPQAVLKFLPQKNIEFQSLFYQLSLTIIEMDPAKGELLANKMCQSSFVAYAYDFKLVANRLPNHQAVTSILGRLLSCFCLSIESSGEVRKLYDEILVDSIVNFNVPVQEWNSLLVENANEISGYMNSHRTVVLCLLACSHIADCSLVPLAVLQPFLERFCSNPSYMSTLSALGKRYFLYLCCQSAMSSPAAVASPATSFTNYKFIGSYLTQNKDVWSILFHESDTFLVWLVKVSVPVAVFQKCLETYFSSSSSCSEQRDTERLTSLLHQHNCLLPFIEFTFKAFVSMTSNDVVMQSSREYLTILLAIIPEARHDYLKHLIHKNLMITEEFNHSGITVYVNLLNVIVVQSSSNDITDEDLKLFCRLLEHVAVNTLPMLLCEVLQFCHLILKKCVLSQDIKPVTIIMRNAQLFTTFSTLFFDNASILENSTKNTLLMERLHCGIVLVTSSLMQCGHTFGTVAQSKIVCRKNNMIELLVCTDYPLLQLALLKFWSGVFEANDQATSTVIQFTDSDDENSSCQLHTNDLHLVLIALQNLHFNRDTLVRREAAICNLLMFENIVGSKPLHATPWMMMLKRSVNAMSSSVNIDSAMITMLETFLFITDEYSSELGVSLCQTLSKTIEQFDKQDKDGVNEDEEFLMLSLFHYIQTFLDRYLLRVEYETLKTLKADLKTLEKKRREKENNEAGVPVFVNIFGLIYNPSALKLSCKDSQAVNNLRKILQKRITEMDDDETESGDD